MLAESVYVAGQIRAEAGQRIRVQPDSFECRSSTYLKTFSNFAEDVQLGPDATEEVITMIHSVTGGVFRSVDMMIPRLLELWQRNEKKLAEGSVKMQDLVKTAASRLMI